MAAKANDHAAERSRMVGSTSSSSERSNLNEWLDSVVNPWGTRDLRCQRSYH